MRFGPGHVSRPYASMAWPGFDSQWTHIELFFVFFLLELITFFFFLNFILFLFFVFGGGGGGALFISKSDDISK